VSITVAGIILTGVLGNIICEAVLKIFRIENRIAKGVAIGTASHAIGTSRAMQIGEIEGAISSLSIVTAGIMTVLLAGIFSGLY
jgi:putative effector of murein hydrolase